MTQPDLVIRGRLLSFSADAGAAPFYVSDGVVCVQAGRIMQMGQAQDILPSLPAGTPIDHYPYGLIMPGFIDLHIHYVQARMIASYGAQLMAWLHNYTFPAEEKFRDAAYCQLEARFFLDELLRNGTTSAAIYGSVHPQSVEALFAESAARGTLMVAGKVLMDRNVPASLCDTAQTGYYDSEALIHKWHQKHRQHYAITPRFAISSTEAQLQAAGALALKYPSAYVQTHLAENTAEIAATRALFPQDASYTAIYQRFGLLGARSLLGHCVHLSAAERALIAAQRAVAVFCPTSNLFLGSGLFDHQRLAEAGVRVGMATDVGAGTSYSMLRTAAEAYKILQLQQQNLPAFAAFRLITRGNAEALQLDHVIGSLEAGFDADIIVLNSEATPAMRHRRDVIGDNLADELFMLMMLGDDRAIAATYVAGKRVAQSAAL